ncbi:alcohol acetyltransferase [Mycena filopes]|nr:alcohol acetyltransferase [Mycena filopes]
MPPHQDADASQSHIRPIGLLERYHAARNFLGLDSCVVASAKYVTRDLRPLSRGILFPALRQVIEANPPLCVRLTNETRPDAAFTQLHEINLLRVVEFLDTDDFQAALEAQLARGFDTEADLPLWRIGVLADSSTIIFAVHHAVGDGLSTLAFHASLLQALRNAASEDIDTIPIVKIPPSLVLRSPVEQVVNIRPSFRTIFGEVYADLAERWPRARSTVWTGNPVPQRAKSLRTHVRLLSIPAEDVVSFRATCRTHGATLTSAFYVLTVAIISRLLTVDGGPRSYKTISAAVAISLREAAGIGPSSTGAIICDFVSAHTTHPPADPAFSWAAAARYAVVLRAQKRGAAAEKVGMLRFLGDDCAPYLAKHLGARRTGGFVLSNLGCFNLPQAVGSEGTWDIVSTVFAQCDVVVGAAFKLNVVCDPSGVLNLALTYGEDGIGALFVEMFVSQFRDSLYELLA